MQYSTTVPSSKTRLLRRRNAQDQGLGDTGVGPVLRSGTPPVFCVCVCLFPSWVNLFQETKKKERASES